MTLIELLVFILNIAIGVWLAIVLQPIGGLWLAFAGFVAGIMLIPGAIISYERYRKWAYCGDDLMPPCLCGSSEFRVEVVGDNDFHNVCQSCGNRYDNRRGKVSGWLTEIQSILPAA